MTKKNMKLSADQYDAVMSTLAACQVAFQIGAERKSMITVNYDGSGCVTVKELASANHCTDMKAAAWAMYNAEGELRNAACRYVKSLAPSPDSFGSGVAIVLTFDKPSAMQLAISEGDDWSGMHVTLGYFGVTEDLNGKQRGEMIKACMKTVAKYRPFVARANGITRFSTDGDDPQDTKDALVVNIDSHLVGEIRQVLLAHLAEYGIGINKSHGFTPHCTLGFIDATEDMPIQRWSPMDAQIVALELWAGGAHERLVLGTPYAVEESNVEPDMTELDGALLEEAITPPDVVPQAKDVYRGAGSVPNRGKSKRCKKIIERARTVVNIGPDEEKESQ